MGKGVEPLLTLRAAGPCPSPGGGSRSAPAGASAWSWTGQAETPGSSSFKAKTDRQKKKTLKKHQAKGSGWQPRGPVSGRMGTRAQDPSTRPLRPPEAARGCRVTQRCRLRAKGLPLNSPSRGQRTAASRSTASPVAASKPRQNPNPTPVSPPALLDAPEPAESSSSCTF